MATFFLFLRFHLFTLSNMYISMTSGLIAIKFYVTHNWGGGKAAYGFGTDRIKTLVSMATNSSPKVKMGKTVLPLFLGCFSFKLFYTSSAGNEKLHDSSKELEVRPDPTTDGGVRYP